MEDFYSFLKEELEDQSVFYEFVTNRGIIYTVAFDTTSFADYIQEFPTLLQRGYSLGFKPSKDKERGIVNHDKKIATTVQRIILDFLDQSPPETVLYYHCDTADNRQSCRNRLFEVWEKELIEHQFVKECVKVEIPFEEGSKDHYLGYITNSNNPSIDIIRGEFQQFCILLMIKE